ncbi:WxcM-like domain-containing protein [Lutibacter sp.]|uniref:WxcM-like domain-containing protein n=1 Tax=Lutibacter sp. TaxID=1925666 RepID=UPI0025BFB930|nr:WxcM-like domain-containing protein [Lutibacter sp.]MCF6182106.1 WxcM-like domain-containing protein [Lutibacter sp.]
MFPKLILGGCYEDARGTIKYNNRFNASEIKRFYLIENKSLRFVRAWQGHKIEQRWFLVSKGSFKIQLIAIDNWEHPSKNLIPDTFFLNENQFDILHVPSGYVSSIQVLERESKLIVMANYLLGEINDEYRYDVTYFNI